MQTPRTIEQSNINKFKKLSHEFWLEVKESAVYSAVNGELFWSCAHMNHNDVISNSSIYTQTQNDNLVVLTSVCKYFPLN